MTLRIANGAGFLGDNLDAPRLLLESGQIDVLTLEYLAELTLSILARVREKNPQAGYAADFLDVLRSLLTAWRQQPHVEIVTNAGGMNPTACARAAGQILAQAGQGQTPIGVVMGDDLLARLPELQAAGCTLANMETGEPLSALTAPVVSANAYLGAAPLAEALGRQARLVITGRVADASLTVAPALLRFGWNTQAWDLLAAASVAGHLIECGAQCTGGFYTHWEELLWGPLGYPIAELEADGRVTITKPTGTGGRVTRETVAEQLVYEIGDPAHYLTPDVDVDFSQVTLTQQGVDRVLVAGARGAPAPEQLKVSLAYRDGYAASGQLLVYGRSSRAKAQACAAAIFARLRDAGAMPAQSRVELLGTGQGVPGFASPQIDPPELVLRVAVADQSREIVERFAKEIAPLATSGPAGLAGYTTARASVRPVFAYWPTLVPRELVPATVTVQAADQWARSSA